MATTEAMVDSNPFVDSLRFERRIPECTIVIFGANGDLAKRKLLPALYSLAHDRRLSAGFAVAGNSRTAMSDEDFRARMQQSVKELWRARSIRRRSLAKFRAGTVLRSRRCQGPCLLQLAEEAARSNLQ